MNLDQLIELGDLDELVREVDRLVERRDWDGLVRLRDRSRAAFERGMQLWPAASLAEYRLALEAPGRWAAGVIVEGAGRFAMGPLPEVAASRHSWSELAPHLEAGPIGATVAHESVVRGEDLTGDRRAGSGVGAFDPLPLRLQPWEPAYPLAAYDAERADFPRPDLPRPTAAVAMTPEAPESVAGSEGARALVLLADAWVTGSNGRATAVEVEAGGVAAALAALGVTEARVADLSPADAMAFMAWTAASGGAHARRRGMAAGRFDAWWAAAAVTGTSDDWPPDVLGEAIGRLRWLVWDAGEPDSGWWIRLAVEDPDSGRAWAVSATDAR